MSFLLAGVDGGPLLSNLAQIVSATDATLFPTSPTPEAARINDKGARTIVRAPHHTRRVGPLAGVQALFCRGLVLVTSGFLPGRFLIVRAVAVTESAPDSTTA